MKAKELSAKDFDQEVLKSEVPVLVDFWAPWCGPCRMMAPILDEIAKEMDGKIHVIKVNTEEEENVKLASEYQIMSIPNMKLFKDGKVIEEFVGMRPKEMMIEEIKKHL